ncbi:MAG: hypothetical protein HY683_07495 [Chloroflexi bacterium]|nr:hypothetical protein [Chloroflexota bacterium]
MPAKYQQEIEEILRQAGKAPPAPRPAPRRLSLRMRLPAVRLAWFVSPTRVLLVSIALLLIALLIHLAVPGLALPFALFVSVGLVLLITAYAMFYIGRNMGPEKRWRGRPVDDSPSPTWWRRFGRRGRR